MNKIIIFGNSGSGKSTFARKRSGVLMCNHLDLDTVAWEENCAAPTRKPLDQSAKLIEVFLTDNDSWVVEGCYSGLLELVAQHCTEMIFLNPGVETCKSNCRNRPWEPHKYNSPEEQNANLEMLLSWIADYNQREDEFSLREHQRLFEGFTGKKQEYTSNN